MRTSSIARRRPCGPRAGSCPGWPSAPPPATATAAEPDKLANPAIDPARFLRVAHEAVAWRESRRIGEDEFIAMARDRSTVVLDARSREMYGAFHVKGAVNLPFPDIAVSSLARLLPDKNVRILIYCNNNFEGAPETMATKLPSASLNLSTFAALYNYGYRNVYELGPQLDVRTTRIPFVGKAR